MKNQTKRWLTSGGVATATFLALDGAWIASVAKGMYDKQIPHLMGSTLSPAPAAVFYFGYLAGTIHLAVRPYEEQRSWKMRLRDGAVLGALAYGTWGFTGSSILKDFPIELAAADCAWGAVLTGVTAAVAGAAMDKLTGSRRCGR